MSCSILAVVNSSMLIIPPRDWANPAISVASSIRMNENVLTVKGMNILQESKASLSPVAGPVAKSIWINFESDDDMLMFRLKYS